MSVSGQRICRLAEAATDAPDPEDALEMLTHLRREVDQFERQQVARALTEGRSFEQVARALGVSRQAAHSRFKDLSQRRGMSGMPPTPEVRLAIEYAGAEAQALGDPSLAPAHLLLGMLRAGDRRAAAALTDAGVSLEATRRAVAEGRPAVAGGDADRHMRALLAEAVRVAKRDGHERIGVEHLLRAALSPGHDGIPALLRRLDTPPARVLQALDGKPDDAEGCLER